MNINEDAANTNINRGAPWHLWLVAGLMAIWNALGVFDYLATVFRYEPYLSQFSEEALSYYFAAPLWMFGIWATAVFGGLVGGILLIMRNKLALTILSLSVIAQTYGILSPAPEGATNVPLSMAVIAIAALVLLYAIWQKRRGVLR